MAKQNNKYLLICLLVSYCAFCHSSTSNTLSANFIFRHLSLEHGLSQNSPYAIIQDKHGFMWIGTGTGLNRFDGYEFKHYNSNNDSSNSLSDGYIRSLLYDSNGIIWIGTRAGILNKFDPSTHAFTHYKYDRDELNFTSSNYINALTEDHKGTIWLGTERSGLNYFNPLTNKVKQWASDTKDIAANLLSSDITVLSLVSDSHKYLWIGTKANGLFRLNPDSGQLQHYSLNTHDKDNSGLPSNHINALFMSTNNTLWIGGDAGLSRFNIKQNTFVNYQHVDNNLHTIPSNKITKIIEDKTDNLWIGTAENGLFRFNQATETFDHFIPDAANPNSISGRIINTLYEDRSGVIWVATHSQGLNSFHPRTENFNLLSFKTEHRTGLERLHIFGLHLDSTNKLWIGAAGNLSVWDRKTNIIKTYTHNPDDNSSISGNIIRYITQDSQGTIWVGVADSGLNRYIPETDSFQFYVHDKNNPKSLSHSNIKTIHEDKKGNFWIATFGGGLNLMNRETGEFKSYQHNPDDPNSISSNDVYYIYEDKKNNLWLATYDGTLNEFSIKTETFTHHINPNIVKNNITNPIVTIHQGASGHFWIGTMNRGLEKYDPNTGEYFSYKEENGLVDNTVYSILEDNTGALWLTTNKGIVKFQPNKGLFTNYDVNDGLQENEFNGNAALKISESEFMFGGINGITWFDPQQIRPMGNPNRVLLTDFLVFNSSVPLNSTLTTNTDGQYTIPQPIEITNELTLSYRESLFFGFTFSSFNYQNHRKPKFAYKLEGWDKDWINTDYRNRRANYSNIPAGKYIFRIKSATGINNWKQQPVGLHITIHPLFWKSIWAYLIYLITLAGLTYWYMGVHRRKAELIQERLNSSHLKQLDKLKNEFLANTSHELRTPLNGIIGISESLLQGSTGALSIATSEQLSMVVSSAHRLAKLVDDILDFAKLQKHNLTLKLTSIDLFPMVNMVLTMSESMLEKPESLELINSVDKDLVPVLADENRLQQILYNLVGNAIKFTPSGSIEITASYSHHLMTINIKDTGIGIPEDKLETIFEHFQQLGDSNTRLQRGTGLGLAVTRQLIILHGGEISVESTLNKGSTFSFTLPLSYQRSVENPLEYSISDRKGKVVSLQYTSDELSDYSYQNSIIINDNKDIHYTLLIVDDEEINRQVLLNHLSSQNLQLLEADNGQQALKILKENQTVDLILLDIMMPNMNGYDVCKAIRKTHNKEHLPIVFLTAKNQVIDLADSFAVGANDFISKPVSQSELLSRLKVHLQLLESHRTLEQKVTERTENLQAKNQELKVLDDIIAAINTEMEFSHLLDTILSECMNIYHEAKKGFFLIKHNKYGKFHLTSSYGFAIDKPGHSLFTFEQLETLFIANARKLSEHVYLIHSDDKSPLIKYPATLPVIDSLLVITMETDGDIMGFLMIENTANSENIHQAYIDCSIRLQRHIQNAIIRTALFKKLRDSNNTILKAQEQLITQEKMASLGILSAGIAHEINNPTNFVHISAQNLNSELKSFNTFFLDLIDDEQDNEIQALFKRKLEPLFLHLKTILDGTLRIRNIVNDLRSYSSAEKHQFDEISIEQCLQSTLNLVQNNYRSIAIFELRLTDNPIITCIPSQLNQVFMNIIINACDAISLQQEIEPELEGRVILETQVVNQQLRVRIMDNGHGMTQEVRDRSFEPFYTTKKSVAGLGLSIAYGIMEHHKGSICVEPNHPKGTTFNVIIPLVDEEA